MSAFTPEQVAYLRSLPAVEAVTRTRIWYATEFRRACLRAYEQGAHPVDLFRAAGLDPKIVGYKRIERAFARWRREAHVPAYRASGRPPMDESSTFVPMRFGAGRSAASPSESAPGGNAAAGSAAFGGADPRDLLIAQQMHYIRYLEHELAQSQSDESRQTSDGDS